MNRFFSAVNCHCPSLWRDVISSKCLYRERMTNLNFIRKFVVRTSSKITADAQHNTTDKWEKWFDKDLPQITVPSKAMKRLKRMQAKNELAAEKERAYRGDGPLIISCKRAQFNHFVGHRYPKGELNLKFLATQGWKHPKSAGDWMIMQPFMNLPAFHDTQTESFKELNIWPELENVVKGMSVFEPTYIQEKAIPEILSGNNTLIAAETGSGKTLAYLLPMIQNIRRTKSETPSPVRPVDNTPLGLIILPSKELVDQVKPICEKLCEPLGLSVDSVAGKGREYSPKPIDILVATPGSLAPLAHHKVMRLSHVQNLVLDEGDTLMDNSFNSTIQDIMRKMNINTETTARGSFATQLVIASATMPREMRSTLGDLVDMDSITEVKTPKLHHISPHVKQRFERVKPSEKSDIVTSVIKRNHERMRPTLVFCNTSSSVFHLAYKMEEAGIEHHVLTGASPDYRRDGQFDDFQNGSSLIMLATDIASRGLDTRRVKHVINYDFPNFVSDYIHRTGRVGRVGSPRKSMVSSFVSQRWEVDVLWNVEKSVRRMTALEHVDANIKRVLTARRGVSADDQFVSDTDLFPESFE